MISRIQLVPIVLALGLISGSAHAALQGRDLNGSAGSFEAYYDTDLDITWLADANALRSLDWYNVNALAASLSFTDGVSTYDDWRLPTTLQPDASCDFNSFGISLGYNCTGSEMGHLFYSELGGTAGQSILTSADPDLAKFTNLVPSPYWSGSEYIHDGYAWSFNFFGGYQDGHAKGQGPFGLAVSSGDVGAVPELDTWAMLLAGLVLVGVATRRRRG